MTVYFTADHHFGHRNIIRFCSRPFSSSDEMGDEMVKRWNASVSNDDDVYILGDFAWSMGRGRLRELFSALAGRKHLILGNHDRADALDLPWSSDPANYRRIDVDGRTVILSHYGLRVWEKMRYGAIHLYGHSHGNLPGFRNDSGGGCCDVGVDCWNFAPVCFDDVVCHISQLPQFNPEGAVLAG